MLITQVQLPEQDQLLGDLGRERRVAKSELVRQAVDLLLANEDAGRSLEEQRRRAAGIAGRFRSGEKHTARDHDAALAETFSWSRDRTLPKSKVQSRRTTPWRQA